MNLHGLVNFYDEPVDSIARCLNGLALAGVSHVVVVDGAYALYPKGRAASPAVQHGAWVTGAAHLGLGITLVVPQVVWAGNEVEKRTALFTHALPASQPGDWWVVIDTDEFFVDVPDDLHDRLAATDLEVAECKAHDMVAERLGRRDMPPFFPVRKFYRAQPIEVETSHSTYRTADGRYLWADASHDMCSALQLYDVVVEHHPDRRPPDRQAAKMRYYSSRDFSRIERRNCDWCDNPAVRLVTTGWRFHAELGCPIGDWHEACRAHADAADRIARVDLARLGINPDTVKAENRMGRPPEPDPAPAA